MARVVVEGERITVRLGPGEVPAARRRTVRLPGSALRRVGIEPDWWRVLRGEAGPGRWLPGRCVGVRHGPDGTDFVAVRAGGPVLWLELAPGAPFSRVSVSDPAPEATARALRGLLPQGLYERRDAV
jgi:hypothetical protein